MPVEIDVGAEAGARVSGNGPLHGGGGRESHGAAEERYPFGPHLDEPQPLVEAPSGRIGVDDVEANDSLLVLEGKVEHPQHELGSNTMTATVRPHHDAVHEELIGSGAALEGGCPHQPAEATQESKLPDDVTSLDGGECPAIEMKTGQADQDVALERRYRPIGSQRTLDEGHPLGARADGMLQFEPEGVPVEMGGGMAVTGLETDDDPDLGIAVHERTRYAPGLKTMAHTTTMRNSHSSDETKRSCRIAPSVSLLSMPSVSMPDCTRRHALG